MATFWAAFHVDNSGVQQNAVPELETFNISSKIVYILLENY